MAHKFEIRVGKDEQFRFTLEGDNGEVIAQSEGYTTQKACEDGIDAVKKYAADAPVILPEGL